MIEHIGAGEGNRTLVISLEGYQTRNDINAEVDIFSVRARLDVVRETGLVHVARLVNRID